MQKIRNLLQDPLSPDFWKLWSETAKENTEIYRRVFHCVPDDNSNFSLKDCNLTTCSHNLGGV